MAARIGWYRMLGVHFDDPATTSLMMGCWVHAPRGIAIGSRSSIGPQCFLDGRGGITIGRNVNISGMSRLITGTHDAHSASFAGRLEPIMLHDRVWLATGATILPGVTMGEGAVAAAGAVVTANVDPFTVVGGVPAQPIADRPRDLVYELGFRENWR